MLKNTIFYSSLVLNLFVSIRNDFSVDFFKYLLELYNLWPKYIFFSLAKIVGDFEFIIFCYFKNRLRAHEIG